MFSDFMATFFANMLPYVIMVQAAAYYYFTQKILSTNTISYYTYKVQDIANLGTTSLLIACCCLICPWRSILDCCVGGGDVNENNKKKYNDVVLGF